MHVRDLASRLLGWLPRRQKNLLRAAGRRWHRAWVRKFRSYGPDELLQTLRALGIREGDTLMCHSAFKPEGGFEGKIGDVTDTMLRAIGDSGNLIMMSLPYRGMTYMHLKSGHSFDVRSTPSRMGLISEFFRRREGVLRSLSPTHPVLAYGPKAEWIVADHERCVHPCGPGTPFDKALALEGKLVFFDTTLDSMTFFHWIEHYVQDQVGLTLYDPELFQVPVTDHAGEERTVATYAFSPEIIPKRRLVVLHEELDRRGVTASRWVGNTKIIVVSLRDIVSCVDEMIAAGRYFYDT